MQTLLGTQSRRATSRAIRSLSLVLLFALIFVMSSASLPKSSADTNLIQSVSTSSTIRFGAGIDMRFDAQVNAPVAEVRSIFKALGNRAVSSYAYPAITTSPDGSRITAEFTIDTGVRAYYPPGTEFEIQLEVTDSSGDVSLSYPVRILYLDPAKPWRHMSNPDIPLDIHYYGFSDSTAHGLADRVAASWEQIAAALGIEPGSVGRFRAIIYPNVDAATYAFPPTSAAATDGEYFGGFAMDRYGLFILGIPVPRTVVHELTHLLVGSKVNSLLSPSVPSWLNEGLAQYFEAGSSDYYTSQLGRAARNDQLLVLRNRNTVPSQRSEISLFYLEVGSFVGDLIERHGADRMAETLRLINDGQSAADAVEAAYGVPLWQLENEWRVRLGASELPAPATPTPSPSETSTPGPTATPQATATVPGTSIGDTGVTAGAQSQPGGGFNWTGPLIGAITTGIVFTIWSVSVSRRRFRSRR
jgi:hypothetical protein